MDNQIERCHMCGGAVIRTGKNVRQYKTIDAEEVMKAFDYFQKWLKGECRGGKRNKNNRVKA